MAAESYRGEVLDNLGVEFEWRTLDGAMDGLHKPVHLSQVIDRPTWQRTTECVGRLYRDHAIIGTFNLGEHLVQTSQRPADFLRGRIARN